MNREILEVVCGKKHLRQGKSIQLYVNGCDETDKNLTSEIISLFKKFRQEE